MNYLLFWLMRWDVRCLLWTIRVIYPCMSHVIYLSNSIFLLFPIWDCLWLTLKSHTFSWAWRETRETANPRALAPYNLQIRRRFYSHPEALLAASGGSLAWHTWNFFFFFNVGKEPTSILLSLTCVAKSPPIWVPSFYWQKT